MKDSNLKFISHRGNLVSRDEVEENNPNYIDNAASLGFDVEIDVWEMKSELFLGHDEPQYKININWLLSRKSFLWVHCKNTLSLESCFAAGLNCFFHDKDWYTITSKGFIWSYPGSQICGTRCILVLPSLKDFQIKKNQGYFGVCSDEVITLKESYL